MGREVVCLTLKDFCIDNVYTVLDSCSISQIVMIADKKPLDLGALTYSKREKKSGKAQREVDDTTFEVERGYAISYWLKKNTERYLSGLSEKTFVRECRTLISMVEKFDELESNAFKSADCLNETYARFRTYVHGLRHPDGSHYESIDSRLSSASNIMDAFCSGLNYRKYPVKKLQGDIAKAKKSATVSPQDELVKESLTLAFMIFSGLYSLIKKPGQYPMSLKLPKEEVWLFPIRQFCATDELLRAGKPTLERNVLWNYKVGRVNTVEEMMEKYPLGSVDVSKKKYALRCHYQEAIDLIEVSNADLQCLSRRRLMNLAQFAYLTMFIANTGMNESILRDLEFQAEWADEDFLGERIEVGFRGLKARAGNKVVTFNITVVHLKEFKRFIKLRNEICNGNNYKYLFVAMDSDGLCIDEPLANNSILEYYRKVRSYFYPKIKSISFRQWRKYKFDNVSKLASFKIAVDALQNTETTAISNYMEQACDESVLEISRFIKAYDQGLKLEGRSNALLTPAGACGEPGSPQLIKVINTIAPDCRNFLGCLFCENFLTHAIEADIRKLVSMKYFLNKIMPLSKSGNAFESTGGLTVQRIDEFLETIKKISPEIYAVVRKLECEVDEFQALDSYWQSKLHLLSKLDLV